MIIASRILKMTASSGVTDIRIDIFQPTQDGDGWICRYIVNWPDIPWESYAAGHDAVQALFSAMQKIGIELYASNEGKSGHLTWDDWRGFGFPVPQNMRDRLIGDDAKFL